MRKYRSLTLIIIIGIIINIFFLCVVRYDEQVNLSFIISLSSEHPNDIQVFSGEEPVFSELRSTSIPYHGDMIIEDLEYRIPAQAQWIRIDFGSMPAAFDIGNVRFQLNELSMDLPLSDLLKDSQYNMISNIKQDDTLKFTTTGNDAFCIINLANLNPHQLVEKYAKKVENRNRFLLCTFSNLCLFFVALFRKKIFAQFRDIKDNWSLIWDISVNDFKTRYAGSYLGIVWAFIQPVVIILVYWFVFQVGFRSGTLKEVPFVLWLSAGLVPWFFFNEALNSATTSLIDYSYLVKKVVFNIRIIPLVKIMSALFVHGFFVLFILTLYVINDIFPEIYWLQIFYFSAYMIVLCLGLTYATSALMIFFRDLSQIINVILQIGIWLTPIMWDYTVISEKYRWILKLNPMYYVIEGYRNALIYHNWFWNNTLQTVYAWSLAIILLIVGNLIFNRLKEYFADAL